MDAYNVAEAKTHFSALVERVEAGDSVEIMRRGKPVARLIPIQQAKQPVDLAALRKLTATLPFDPNNSVEEMRKLDRY